MSSPANDDAGKHAMPARPWAQAALERREQRRLRDEIAVTKELLKQGPHATTSYAERTLSEERVADDVFELAKPRSEYFELEEPRLGIWSPALEPVVMPLPPPDIDRRPGLRAVLMVGGAIGIAAGVAFAVMKTLQRSATSPVTTRETNANVPVLSTAVLGSLAQIGTAQANVRPDAVAASPASPVLAAAPARTEQANADIAAASSLPLPAMVTAAAPAAPGLPELAAPPAPVQPTTPLARNEVAMLMKRGRDLLAAGDIASARLILARLATNGEAAAALLLAGTYDAAELAKARFVGAVPDAAKARAWYERAAAQGSPEAKRRLQQSALR